MNKLVVLSGVPGSGKSFLTLAMRQMMQNGHLYIVSSDELRRLIGGSQVNFENDALVWTMYYDLAKVYSYDKNGVVILDSTNVTRDLRIDKVKPIKACFDEVDLVVFNVDGERLIKQNKNRPFPVPDDVLRNFVQIFQQPNNEDKEFFDKVYEVKNNDLTGIISDLTNFK